MRYFTTNGPLVAGYWFYDVDEKMIAAGACVAYQDSSSNYSGFSGLRLLTITAGGRPTGTSNNRSAIYFR